MVELVAQSLQDSSKRWGKPLPPGQVILGKHPDYCQLVVDWDVQVSRIHASLEWKDGRLWVQRISTKNPPFKVDKLPYRATNPIFYRDEDQRFTRFSLAPGESFVIGETRFTLMGPAPVLPEEPAPSAEMTCVPGELEKVRFLDPDERLEVLSDLPEVIRFTVKDEELEQRVATVLLRGIPRARAAAVVRLNTDRPAPTVEVLAAQQRDREQSRLKPSVRLVHKALRSGKNEVYGWDVQNDSSQFTTETLGEFEWALCVPLPEESSPGWALYVSGRLAGPPPAGTTQADLLKPDMKFAGLVADVFGSLRLVRDLRKRHDELARFLSRSVMAELARCEADGIAAVLEAREVNATVLFCDLRGFSKLVESESSGLAESWRRVREALGIMTSNITDRDGVVGDFQGDAAMGFWGWPEGSGDADERLARQVEHAARASLATWRDFGLRARERDHPLSGFACGIGVATGAAFAGRLGTPDQFKVGAYGHVVNLASRLESLTKRFGTGILLDEATAKVLEGLSERRWFRLRRVARVRPHGMNAALTVRELLPPHGEPGTIHEKHRERYETALDAFLAGKWAEAARQLELCDRQDGPVHFLKEHIEKHALPAKWDGVIPLPK